MGFARGMRGFGACALLLVAAIAVAGCSAASAHPLAASHTAIPTPSPTPTDAASLLLADADALAGPGGKNMTACAVSFAGDDIASPPLIQQQGLRFDPLPVPTRTGSVFAGWYTTPAAATALDTTARINGAHLVACQDRRLTLYGGWTTPAQVAALNTGVPILMYHQFTTKPGGESGWLRANYIYSGDFDAQMAYIKDKHFYLPTWDELEAFIDGQLMLPKNSVIVTDDDADPSWFQIAVPIVNKYGVLATSYVITESHDWPSPSIWVLQRSHTNDMHHAGANGKGLMVNLTADQIAADMDTSAQILGVRQVMAYPFGHYDATAEQGLRQAGFDMAVTIDFGYVRVGSDKLALPRVRMSYGESVQGLADAIG